MNSEANGRNPTIERLLHQRFLRSVSRTEGATALSIAGHAWTYRELAELACGFAVRFRALGVGRNDRVGLLLPKSPELYAGVLGTLMAGAAYVPLEPGYPVERLRHILTSAEPSVLVHHDADLFANLIGGMTPPPRVRGLATAEIRPLPIDEHVPPDSTPHDLAYVLFTSGSSGRPKGVMVTHENACAFVDWAVDRYGIRPEDRLANHSDLTFDLSVFDMFTTWSAGAALFPLVSLVEKAMPGQFIADHGISIWFSVPSVLAGMSRMGQIQPAILRTLRKMLFCGEPLPPTPVRELMKALPDLHVANLYGPTEATVACSAYDVPRPPAEDARGIPIGWRTGETEIFVWTEEDGGRIACEGETGEVHIAGSQVSPGYWRNPEETRARFIPDPRFPDRGAPCYRTGDLAVVQPEGPIFLGRKDFQVKYRGWRIELGDIENALISLEGIAEAAVVLKKGPSGVEELTGFVRSREGIKADDIVRRLGEKIPAYMIPTRIHRIDDFPRTLNGKIDRKQL